MMQTPDSVILEIFQYLDVKNLVKVSTICQKWWRISKDESLWKRRFLLDNKLSSNTVISSCSKVKTWYAEYRRIVDETPRVLSQKLTDHTDEVLHVAFSHSGSIFSTCSKDCTVKIWSSDYPCKLIFDENLRVRFNWNYTQFSQFNVDDSLLLVSGVHFGHNTTSGEICVFEIDNDELIFRSRVRNKPYDVFGCWFSRDLLLNGELHMFGHLSSCSEIFLCRASQELQSVKQSVIVKLFKFVNFHASTIRMVLVTNLISDWVREAIILQNKLKMARAVGQEYDLNLEIDKFREALAQRSQTSKENEEEMDDTSSCSAVSFINYNTVEGDRLLIFTTGTETYTPHQVGFKLIKYETVKSMLEEEVMPEDRLKRIHDHMRQLREQQSLDATEGDGPIELPDENAPELEDNFFDMAFLQANFDFPDYLIDMRGHIIGIALSPDKRYLFVNVRPWPDGSTISDPLQPLPIAQQVDLRVIDMEKLQIVQDKVYRGHKGFTPNDECFFIFMDSCDDFVASGSEDKFAYVWERHYGLSLGQMPHDRVVNSVAFNPKSSEMLVSVSDDYSINIWRSKRTIRNLHSEQIEETF